MVTYGFPAASGTLLSIPTREEWRAMLRSPLTACVALVCATLVVLGALGSIVFLAWSGNGTEAIGGLILGLVGLVLGKLRTVERQTNGTMTRVLDAALPTPPRDPGQ